MSECIEKAVDFQKNACNFYVNEMPAPTWHKLKVNRACFSFDVGDLDCQASNPNQNSCIDIKLDGVSVGECGAFDEALKNCKTYSKPETQNVRAVEVSAKGNVDPEDLNYPALSTYQKRAVLLEIDGTPAKYFATGMGASAEKFMADNSLEHHTLIAKSGAKSSANVYIGAAQGTANFVCIDLIARKNSDCSITIIYEDAKANSDLCANSIMCEKEEQRDANAIVGCCLRVFASANSRVDVNVVQALTQDAIVLDNSGYSLCAGAQINVEQRVLGGVQTYVGLTADLHGNNSTININTKYVGSGKQNHDFNYSIKQRGRNTSSNLDANGILAGLSKKTLRGTIDFVHGCKGSVGSESESVLLASKHAQANTNLADGIEKSAGNSTLNTNADAGANVATSDKNAEQTTCKSVPVILCDEEDVSGNHGATIGHLKPETRFYLHARGLNDAKIEQLFLSSFIEDAKIAFSDDCRASTQIEALASKLNIA